MEKYDSEDVVFMGVSVFLRDIYDDNENTELKITYNDIKVILGEKYHINLYEDEIVIDYDDINDDNFPFNEKFKQTILFNYLEQFPFVISYHNEDDISIEMRYMIDNDGEQILEIINQPIEQTIDENCEEFIKWVKNSERKFKIKKLLGL